MPTGKGALRIAIEDFADGFKLGDRVDDWIRRKLKDVVHGLNSDVIKALNALKQTDTGPGFDPYKSIIPVDLGIGGTILVILGVVLSIITTFGNALTSPIANLVTQSVESGVKSQKISIPSFLNLLRMYPEEAARFVDETDFQGYNIERVHAMLLAQNQEISIGMLVALRQRGLISLDEYHKRAFQAGYDETRAENILNVSQIIPTPNDLIFLSVKEAFDDDLSTQFQHDDGFPEAFGEWAAKQGLSLEWTHRYWRAHWNLPSFQQVAEMFQRLRPGKSNNVVTDKDVNQFLKMADYSPFWRERLKEIAFAPFTRVDVRRMYKVGTLDAQQVKEAYKDIGYNDEKAQALTEFTIAYEAEEETGIVRSSVLSAYGDGMIDRTTAESMLSTGGYDATTIAFYLDNADFKEALEVNQIKMSNIKKRFIEGLIDETTVNTEINMLNLPAERVTALLELWTTERENQTALLSITQMEVLLEKGVVTEADYRRVAERRGYTNETIEWTLKRIALEASEKAQIAAEKAEADNERLQKSKTTSQYQKDKAEIDLAISQARAEITDIDVALHSDISPDDIAILTSRKDELKSFIAQMNVAKAQLKFDIQSNLNKLAG